MILLANAFSPSNKIEVNPSSDTIERVLVVQFDMKIGVAKFKEKPLQLLKKSTKMRTDHIHAEKLASFAVQHFWYQFERSNRCTMAPKRTSTPPLTVVSSIVSVPTPVVKVNLISGDSLEEDFLLEDDFVPGDYGSDDEAGAVVDTSTFVEEEEVDIPVKEQIVAEEGSSKKKRKLNNDDASVGSSKKISLKEKKAQRILESTQDVASLGMLPPASLADRFAEKQKKALPKLSGMEFEEIRLQGTSCSVFCWGRG